MNEFTANKVKIIDNTRNVNSLQVSTLNVCGSLVLSRRTFKV